MSLEYEIRFCDSNRISTPSVALPRTSAPRAKPNAPAAGSALESSTAVIAVEQDVIGDDLHRPLSNRGREYGGDFTESEESDAYARHWELPSRGSVARI